MKTNKKAILGMLVAMVMSLGVMGGMNNKKEVSETNLIWGIGSAIITSQEDTTDSLAGSILLNCYGAVVSAGAGAMYGSLCGPGVGTLVGLGVGL